jgi:PAS domain S-box-containing protein
MIDRNLARPLLATFLVSVLTFLIGSAYSQRHLRKIDASVASIAHNASPTIEHATRLRIDVRELRASLVAVVHAAEVSAPRPAGDLRDVEKRIAADLELYFVTPLPNEAGLWTRMRHHSEGLFEAADAVVAALARGELDIARAALSRARASSDALDVLLVDAIAINATTAHALADDIAATRAVHDRVILVVNVVSVLLSLAAMLLALRALRRYAATLHTAEANLEALIASSPDAILLERDGRVVQTNAAARLLLHGSAKRELVGLQTSELWESAGVAVAPPACPEGTNRVRLVRADGEHADLEVAEITIERDGSPSRLVTVRDVTTRVALEARLVMADRLASVGTMAAGVAHEINNPLVYVLHNITFAVEQIERLALTGDRIGGVREALEDASRGAERIRDIVRDLGVLARGDHQTDETVDVHLVLDAAANIAASKLRGGAELVREYGAPPRLRGSGARLGQVALNLIMNAIHAVEGLRDRQGLIVLRTSSSLEGEAVIEVIDNGKGIEPAILGRLFDPFFTTKPTGVGTGLGLSISHTIVTTWGGRLDVSSAPGSTTFRVVLPGAAPANAAAATARRVDAEALPRSRAPVR